MTWDKLVGRAPVNKGAGMIFSGGESYEPKLPDTLVHSDVPLPIKPIDREFLNNPQFVDMTGRKHGRLTVMGLYAANSLGQDRGRWVVRCVCGRYELRLTKTIKKAAPSDMCGECRKVEQMRGRG
jgi:hypothetical protein